MKKLSLINADILLLCPPFSDGEEIYKQCLMQETANIVFNAWLAGESGRGYDLFKSFLSESTFSSFSHPLMGVFTGVEAFEKLHTLITERETNPNQLTFSNIITYQKENSFCFQFDSKGKVSGAFDYDGYNIIQIEIENGKLKEFREYFGYINPLWFG